MNRRGFLGSILAACAAPAIVRADSLMRILPMDAVIVRPRVNTLLTLDQIKREALYIFEHSIAAEFDARFERALMPKQVWLRAA